MAALGRLIVDFIDTDRMTIHQGDTDAALLSQCSSADPTLWAEIASRLMAGSWRLQIELQGWFLHSVPLDVVDGWVGEDIERARMVASLAPLGGAEPSGFARLLLERFGDDKQVRGSFYGTLVSGFWMGNESDRIAGQIDQLTAWRSNSAEPLGLRKWAKEVIGHLEEAMQRALQREAEEGL